MQSNIFNLINIYTDKLYGAGLTTSIPGKCEKKSHESSPGLFSGDDFNFSNYFAIFSAFPVA
jgi:hypothetical protein